MKRVAMVIPLYGMEVDGGVSQYARLVAERLSRQYQMEILTTKARDDQNWKNWYLREKENIHGVLVRRFGVEREVAVDFEKYDVTYRKECENGRRSLGVEQVWFEKRGPYCPELIQYLRRHGVEYDAILFVDYSNYLTVFGLPEVAERAILIPAAQDEYMLHFLTFERFFRLPQAFVFLSEEERLMIRQMFPTQRIPGEVLGMGVDVPDEVDPGGFRQKYGIQNSYLVYVGRVDEEKNCPALFQYFIEYKKRNPNRLKLVVMGEVYCEIPSHTDILAMGYVPEIEKYNGISGATALVLPAKAEKIPTAVLESMSLGTPVIVNGSCSTLRSYCTESNAGLYYSDYFEFEGAINFLLKNGMVYREMCSNALDFILNRYDWDVIVAKYRALIDHATEKPLPAFS